MIIVVFQTEFCYNLQYMEKIQRSRGDPWALRQSGVYQQILVNSRQSTWIILQPANEVHVHLKQALSSEAKRHYCSEGSFLHLHVTFLSSMASSWQDYVEYLHAQFVALVGSVVWPSSS